MDSFHKRFNISIDLEEARRRFINRVKELIFGELEASRISVSDYAKILALKLGEEVSSLINCDFQGRAYFRKDFYQDFYRVLQSLEALSSFTHGYREKERLDEMIKVVLSLSESDIGVYWKDGQFYPSGAKFLDEKLVNEVLDWINEERYSNVKLPFEKGLSHYLRATNKPELLADVITDMYEALEALAKIITQKDKELSGNRELFISRLKLHKCYNQILKEYINYGCEFRHAPEEGRPRILPKPQETEAFIYLTGLFIRLGIKSLEQTEAK